MSLHPILFLGGSGAIGHRSAKALRAVYPDIPLLIGGRNLTKAQRAAQEIGGARGVVIDFAADDLGLGDCQVSAVAIFYMDHALDGLRFAQRRRVPHLSISSGVFEIAPQIARFIHNPGAAPVVLGYEWLVGATTVGTLHIANAFARISHIRIDALVDEQDGGGPTVAKDFEHLNKMLPFALTRRDHNFIWREGDDAKVTFLALDGTPMQATGFSSIDVAGLAAATEAPNVQFNLGSGVSSSRRAGLPMSTEILIEMIGEDHENRPLHTRHALVHPSGAAALTGLSVAMLLERLLGLDGAPPTPAGLYFPYQLIEACAYLERLRKEGGEVIELQVQRD
ncbi:NAD(P)-dependent oxidoreductase [Pseudomonas moraviensis]|uniref:NAD(P)-dependent oxidoreductase n=1 Tax=Pseudomonas moraviensis TaxID=321662 RepID=UPI00135DE176|nr:NAD(P)-dependent oxidoreductase [Pseudomonas moraviensis]MXI49861.1 NAD(P)-dependent oxidoreductase [Pseudomonas moraviensis]